MKRRQHVDAELDQLQRLRIENKRLKNQLSQLRKQMSRIDVDRFQNLKQLLDAQDKEEREVAAVEREDTDKKQWECWDCRVGTLRLTILERRDGAFYWRGCDNCKKRTELQKYDPSVKDGPKAKT